MRTECMRETLAYGPDNIWERNGLGRARAVPGYLLMRSRASEA